GIFIMGSRDKDAQTWRINAAAAALRAAGYQVEVTIDNEWRPAAEREADRTQRADARAERLDAAADRAAERSENHRAAADKVFDQIPFGQPMMPDHYSYRSDRNRRDRATNNMRRSIEESDKAGHLTERAAGVAANEAAKHNPRAIMRRIE